MMNIRPQTVCHKALRPCSGMLPLKAMLATLLVCVVICLSSGPAMAARTSGGHAQTQHKTTQTDDSSQRRHGQSKRVEINISPAQAARAARNVYGGKVLDVILKTNANSPYYRVKLLSGGSLRVVRVTAHR